MHRKTQKPKNCTLCSSPSSTCQHSPYSGKNANFTNFPISNSCRRGETIILCSILCFQSMDKRGASSLGIHRTQLKKRSRKKKLFQRIFDYLKSDSFMFAPLVSSGPPAMTLPPATAGVEIMKPREDENKKMVEKVGDYLKSDSYLYAPLIGPQPWRGADANIAGRHSGPVRLLKRVTAEVSTRIITKKTNQPTEDMLNIIGTDEPSENTRPKTRFAVRRSIAHHETVKHVVHQHCRSSIPGSGILGTEPRKLVVE